MPQARQAYDPRAYWTQLHREGTLRSVGQSGLPVELNVWLYRVLERNLRAFLRRHRLVAPPPRRVFEVGVGTGYWTPFWYHLGAERADGCDLAEEAIARLRQRFPAATFTVGDIVDEGVVPADGSYGLVTVFNVLLHIIDEDRFASAAGHVAAAVRPGGHLLLVEPALLMDASVRPLKPGASSMARPLARYREVFEKAGLEFVTASASTTVANNPIEHGLPHIGRFVWSWRTAVRLARKGPRRASLVGRVLSLVDRLVMTSGVAPSGKILLFRRPDAPRDRRSVSGPARLSLRAPRPDPLPAGLRLLHRVIAVPSRLPLPSGAVRCRRPQAARGRASRTKPVSTNHP